MYPTLPEEDIHSEYLLVAQATLKQARAMQDTDLEGLVATSDYRAHARRAAKRIRHEYAISSTAEAA